MIQRLKILRNLLEKAIQKNKRLSLSDEFNWSIKEQESGTYGEELLLHQSLYISSMVIQSSI